MGERKSGFKIHIFKKCPNKEKAVICFKRDVCGHIATNCLNMPEENGKQKARSHNVARVGTNGKKSHHKNAIVATANTSHSPDKIS